METQRCGGCKEMKPIDQFSASHRGKVGTWCRSCVTANARGERVITPHLPRVCSLCGITYTPKQIKLSRDLNVCSRACKEVDDARSGRSRDAHLRRKYGITSEDYDQMLAEQGGGCALCGVKPEDLTAGRYRKFLHVDHDHKTGRNRGLLCPDHNLLLGRFGDDVAMFRRVVEYLEAA
jgi:hypothetical protein